MFIVETDHEAKGEGSWGLEWAIIGKSSGGNDEDVEKKTEAGETDDDAGDDLVDEEEVVGKGIT